MLKFTHMGVKVDISEIEKFHKIIDNLYPKIQKYNKEVEKSNKLLREQDRLRRALNIKVVDGKTLGLVEDNKKDK